MIKGKANTPHSRNAMIDFDVYMILCTSGVHKNVSLFRQKHYLFVLKQKQGILAALSTKHRKLKNFKYFC